MWKTLDKIRQSFNVCWKNKYSRSLQLPFNSVLHKNNLNLRFKCNWCKCNICPCRFNHFNSSSHNQSKNKRQQTHYNDECLYVLNDWVDAVGWSGVLLLSWYICQPLRHRRAPFIDVEHNAKFTVSENAHAPYRTLVECVSYFVLHKAASNVLPSVKAGKAVPSLQEPKDESFKTDDEFEFNENLRKSCENLDGAHKRVSSALLNFLGTEFMSKGQHAQAYSHFQKASETNNAAAIFNLGICYEMGFGTKQSFKKAAELYRKASDLGHATAMYNLGVFHVHGWGLGQADVKQAQELFAAAANLGQPDACSAIAGAVECDLNFSKNGLEAHPSTSQHSPSFMGRPLMEHPSSNAATQLWFKALNIDISNDFLCEKNEDVMSSADSGVNDLSP